MMTPALQTSISGPEYSLPVSHALALTVSDSLARDYFRSSVVGTSARCFQEVPIRHQVG